MRVLAEVLAHPHPLMPPSSVIDTPHATQRAKASATRTRARVPPQARPKSHIHNVHTSKSATSLCDARWIKVATPPLAWVESSFHTCLLVDHDVNIAEHSFCAFPRGIGGSCTSARDSPSRPSDSVVGLARFTTRKKWIGDCRTMASLKRVGEHVWNYN